MYFGLSDKITWPRRRAWISQLEDTIEEWLDFVPGQTLPIGMQYRASDLDHIAGLVVADEE